MGVFEPAGVHRALDRGSYRGGEYAEDHEGQAHLDGEQDAEAGLEKVGPARVVHPEHGSAGEKEQRHHDGHEFPHVGRDGVGQLRAEPVGQDLLERLDHEHLEEDRAHKRDRAEQMNDEKKSVIVGHGGKERSARHSLMPPSYHLAAAGP